MRYRLLSLALIFASMYAITHMKIFGGETPATLVLGFLLLSAYGMGFFLEKFGMPRITGYIFAGLILGPYFCNFYGKEAMEDLAFLNSLALAFIAFCAGAELKIDHIRDKIKPISFMLIGITLVVFIGVTIAVFCISPIVPFMKAYPARVRIAIAAIFGVISTARSPSSAIAIISETKAKGPFTDIVLSVTVAMDVVVIMVFAVVISMCQVMIVPGSAVGFSFILYLLVEILIAFVLGIFLGAGIVFLIRKAGVELPVIIGAMGFLVIKFCHLLSDYLQGTHDISLHLEPLLICMAAGFTVQNLSKHGKTFIESMDRISLPIYVAFFSITGATIDIGVLKQGWLLGLAVFAVRCVMVFVGSYLTGRLAGEKDIIYNNSWMGFITQAGVSLGLLAEVVRRFPELGVHVQSILIASITLNQIVGPVAFKYVLGKVKETKLSKIGEIFPKN